MNRINQCKDAIITRMIKLKNINYVITKSGVTSSTAATLSCGNITDAVEMVDGIIKIL